MAANTYSWMGAPRKKPRATTADGRRQGGDAVEGEDTALPRAAERGVDLARSEQVKDQDLHAQEQDDGSGVLEPGRLVPCPGNAGAQNEDDHGHWQRLSEPE